nr:hypothetical protein [Tanacetum cinerariifolium]
KDNAVQRFKENTQRNYWCWFNITVVGSTLVLLDKVGAVAEVLKNLLQVINVVRVNVSDDPHVVSEPFEGTLKKDNVVQRFKENAQRDYWCWFNITVVGSTLVLLDKVGTAAEVLKNLL